MNKKLNKKLKAKIFEKFGTQADFAEAIGENDTIVSKVVRGRRDTKDSMKARKLHF